MKITAKIRFLFSDFFFYEFSATSLAQKVKNVVNLSKINARTLTLRDRTADVTYCADVTLILEATSGGLLLIATFFAMPISCVLLL